jgi:hypothetical protein
MGVLIGYYIFIVALLLVFQGADYVRDSRKRRYPSESLRFKSAPATKRLHSHPVDGR